MSIGGKRRGGIASRQSFSHKQKPSERLAQANKSTGLFGTLTEAVKRAVKARDGYRCCKCRTQVLPENAQHSERVLMVDHKIPRAQGGSNAMSNLWTLCDLCHANKPGSVNKRGASLVHAVANQVRKRRRARTK